MRCMARKKSGRKVARLPAVMARPCSTVDQIAISVVAHRKSGELKKRTKGSRAMTAALAMQPIVMRGTRATLALRFSCRSHTRKPGMIAKVKSEMILKVLYV
jgi:hypothetical protein